MQNNTGMSKISADLSVSAKPRNDKHHTFAQWYINNIIQLIQRDSEDDREKKNQDLG